jgi:putative redox protein
MKLALSRIEEPFVFELKNENGAICHIDANESIGGKNKGLSPMQLLAGSIAGCMSIDVVLILKKQRIEPKDYHIEMTAARKEGTPSPFTEINLAFHVSAEVPLDKLEKATALSADKYCSAVHSIHPDILLNFTFHHLP